MKQNQFTFIIRTNETFFFLLCLIYNTFFSLFFFSNISTAIYTQKSILIISNEKNVCAHPWRYSTSVISQVRNCPRRKKDSISTNRNDFYMCSLFFYSQFDSLDVCVNIKCSSKWHR